MKMYLTRFVIGLFLLVSCAPKPADKTISLTGSQAILEGDIVDKANPIAQSTVQIIRFDDEKTRTGPKLRCSATIISESIILTAAHCMTDNVDEDAIDVKADVNGLWIYFSNKIPSWNDRLPDNLIRKAVNGVMHPERKDSERKLRAYQNNVDDIGIISFSGGLPERFTPAKLVDSTAVLAAHQQIIGAGFGAMRYEHRDYTDASQLMSGIFEITDPNFAEREFSANDPSKKQFVCYGDSGGSMYIRDSSGQLLLAGIIVRGVKIVRDINLPSCGENIYQIFTRVSYYLDWISSESKKLNDML